MHFSVWQILTFSFVSEPGHDCSIRLWNLDSKTCVQEITAHRKKLDESIYDVAFHPSKAYIASAGADALAKVFVWHSGTNLRHNSRSVGTKKRECVTAISYKVTNKTLHLICLGEGSYVGQVEVGEKSPHLEQCQAHSFNCNYCIWGVGRNTKTKTSICSLDWIWTERMSVL